MIEANRKIIKNKVGLLNLAEQLGNVSRDCIVMLSHCPLQQNGIKFPLKTDL